MEGVDVIALVDYDNDSVKTSLEIARALRGTSVGRSARYGGVRWSTNQCIGQMSNFRPTGVNPTRLERPQRAGRRGVWRR